MTLFRHTRSRLAVAALLLLTVITALLGFFVIPVMQTAPDGRPYVYELPGHFFIPPNPEANPTTLRKANLGRHLFYERALSFNNQVSCADCHQQALAFTDGRRFSPGASGELTKRNSMSLANVVFNARLTWADDRVESLEDQALIPLTHTSPLEMGFLEDEHLVIARLESSSTYRELFSTTFPEQENPINLENIVKAISAFERTLVSASAPYDRFVAGDHEALTAAAQRGLVLFESARIGCTNCHGGFNFRFTQSHREGENDTSVAYHNTGLYSLGTNGEYPPGDRGLFEITGIAEDMGKFKAPTLRNIALTAPYMHDGSMNTLTEVIDHYASGGRSIRDGLFAGDGSRSPYKSPLVKGFTVSPQERDDLIAFLNSLTDEKFVTDPRFADPLNQQ